MARYRGIWYQGDGGFFEITEEQAYNNAIAVYMFFKDKGFTDEACAGIMGNINHESGFDPNIWLNGEVGSNGYGLIGFVPSRRIIQMRDDDGIDGEDATANGNWQLSVVYEGRWGYAPTHEYPYDTMDDYGQITDVSIAVRAFYANQERGGSEQWTTQEDLALEWYNEIINNFPKYINNNYGAIDWELRRRLVKPF